MFEKDFRTMRNYFNKIPPRRKKLLLAWAFMILVALNVVYKHFQEYNDYNNQISNDDRFKTMTVIDLSPSPCVENNFYSQNKHLFQNVDKEYQNKKSDQRLLLESFIPKTLNKIQLVDVGANRGLFTDMVLDIKPNAVVDQYDVINHFVKDLQKKYKNNRNVHSYHLGLGGYYNKGKTKIRGSRDWASETSFHTGASILKRGKDFNTVLEEVSVTYLDDIYDGRHIDVLKIDTEGMDARVLHGAKKLLYQKKINFIFFENNKLQLQLGDDLFKTVRYLESLGYVSYAFARDGQSLFLNDRCGLDDIFTTKDTINIFAIPKS